MTEETQMVEAAKNPKKRNIGKKKSSKSKMKKKPKRVFPERVGDLTKPKKIDRKMKKLFRKRARDYNSDEEEESAPENGPELENKDEEELNGGGGYSSEEEAGEEDGIQKGKDANFDDEFSDDEDGEIQPGITKFTEGCRAFRMAFKSIIKKSIQDDGLVS